jgi:chemotaxis protein histidine kinase CheA
MDAVKEDVEKLGGTIKVFSKLDEGTTYVIK